MSIDLSAHCRGSKAVTAKTVFVRNPAMPVSCHQSNLSHYTLLAELRCEGNAAKKSAAKPPLQVSLVCRLSQLPPLF